VSGRLTSVLIFPNGVLHVRCRTAARGTLRVRDGVMFGQLGKHRVRGSLGPDLFDLLFEAASAPLPANAFAALRPPTLGPQLSPPR
jgi:hypothetical protein